MTYRRKRAAWLLAATALASAATGHPVAHAENAAIDCGDMSGYQRDSPWPAFKGCATRLSQSRTTGAALFNVASSQTWLTTLTGKGGSPVVAADGTIYVAGGKILSAFNALGQKKWDKDVGGDTLSGLAIGADGTVYLGAGSRLVAVSANGQFKGTPFNAGFGASIISAPLIGPDGTIYFADNYLGTTGSVYALTPTLAKKWQAGYGPVSASLMTSAGGSVIYAGTQLGGLRALRATDGTTIWNSSVSFGATGTGAVGSDGILYVGGTNGRFYAINHLDGSKLWEVDLGSPVLGSPAIGPDGILYVASAGNGLITGSLYAIDPALTATKTWLWKKDLGAFVGGSPVVDSAGSIYLGLMDHTFRSFTPQGVERWRRTTNDQIISTPAITRTGAVVFGCADKQLYSVHDGRSSVSIPPPPQPRAPMSDPVVPVMPFCRTKLTPVFGSATSGPNKREGVAYTKGSLGNGLEYISLFSAVPDPVNDPTFDPNCGAHLCTDDEVRVSPAQESALFKDPTVANTWDPTYLSLPAQLRSVECESVPGRDYCGMNTAQVVWTATNPSLNQCQAGVDSNGNSIACGSGAICARVCPPKGGSGADKNQPKLKCDPAEETRHCVPKITKNCEGLPLMGPGYPDDMRPSISACMEMRECASKEDKLEVSDQQPYCEENGGVCDVVVTPGDEPKQTAPLAGTFPPIGLWTTTEANLCKITQPEKATKEIPESGETSKQGHKKPSNPKKWGVVTTAKVKTSYGLTAKPGGLFVPKANGKAKLELKGRAAGRDIPVLLLDAYANLNECDIVAGTSFELFGQTVDAIQEDKAPSFSVAGGAKAKCEQLVKEAEKVTGAVKEAMFHATRMYDHLKSATNGKPIITDAMCVQAKLVDALIDCTQRTAATATKVANAYAKKYYDTMKETPAKYARQVDGYATSMQQSALADGFKAVNGAGIGSSLNFLNTRQDFLIAAAEAHFPIGPVDLLLAIQGMGYWGIRGTMDYGMTLNGGAPNFKVGATLGPFAGLKVDVFVGAGFDFGIGGAHAGIGADITLINLEIPLSAGATLSAQNVVSDDVRNLGSEFGALGRLSSTLRPKAIVNKQEWKLAGTMQAAAELTVLYGDVDVRLRVRFLWASKTWKKKMASFPPVASFQKSWTGSFTLPVTLKAPQGLADVNQALPLPAIPQFTIPATFTWTPVSSDAHAALLAKAKWECNKPVCDYNLGDENCAVIQ